MNTPQIIAEIDGEIAKLQQARTLLTGTPAKRGPGRPKSVLKQGPSAEGRKKISEAMKARWAARKKVA